MTFSFYLLLRGQWQKITHVVKPVSWVITLFIELLFVCLFVCVCFVDFDDEVFHLNM